jgi:malic enzyme
MPCNSRTGQSSAIGALAAKPVVEGKAALFKLLAEIDAPTAEVTALSSTE